MLGPGTQLGDASWPHHVDILDLMTVESGDFDDNHDGFDPPDDTPARPWLPPDDRLWRHPSELRGSGPAPQHQPSPRRRRKRLAGSRVLTLMVLGGVVGALLATGVATGTHWLGPTRTTSQASANDVTVTSTSARIGSGAGASAAPRQSPINAGPSVMAMVQRVWPSIVTVDVTTAQGHVHGSGLVFRSDGMVVTVARLLAGAAGISVITSDGTEDAATLVGEDPDSGVAVIRVPRQLPSVDLDASPPPAAGEMAIAVGTNAAEGSPPAVAIGTISQVNRQVKLADGPPLLDAIDTDAPAGPAPGGALLDQSGRVLGITTATTDEGGTPHWLAAPADLAGDAANQLASTGKVVYAWLGIAGGDDSAAPASGGVAPGVEVLSVQGGSPAAAAGLKPDDVIDAIDGQPVASLLDLQGVLRLRQPGAAVTLDVMRDGSHLPMEATLGAQGP